MKRGFHRGFGTSAAIGVLVFFASLIRTSGDPLIDGASDSVQVQFAEGDTELASLESGVQLFRDYNFTLKALPAEMSDLTFTRRDWRSPAEAAIDVPAGATIYLLVGVSSPAAGARHAIASSGWTKIADADVFENDSPSKLAVYKRSFTAVTNLTIPKGGFAGVIVAASQIVLRDSGSHDNNPKPPDNSPSTPPVSTAPVDLDGSGPTTRISKLQSSIEALYVHEQSTGGMLGLASRFILTATPGIANKDDLVPIAFATPVGDQMHTVLDEVARAISVHYHLRGVKKIEFSFEDKYTAKDGGSIGAAIGTLMLSMIEGFDIDTSLAITGDVSADAKVLRIGGVAAKLRGAAEAGCAVVAVPADNLEQVTDAVVYEGPGIISHVQVLGISDLDDAAAVCRVDRGANLKQAISLFGHIQTSLDGSRDYLYTPEALEKLQQVVNLRAEPLFCQAAHTGRPAQASAAVRCRIEVLHICRRPGVLGHPGLQKEHYQLRHRRSADEIGEIASHRRSGRSSVYRRLD